MHVYVTIPYLTVMWSFTVRSVLSQRVTVELLDTLLHTPCSVERRWVTSWEDTEGERPILALISASFCHVRRCSTTIFDPQLHQYVSELSHTWVIQFTAQSIEESVSRTTFLGSLVMSCNLPCWSALPANITTYPYGTPRRTSVCGPKLVRERSEEKTCSIGRLAMLSIGSFIFTSECSWRRSDEFELSSKTCRVPLLVPAQSCFSPTSIMVDISCSVNSTRSSGDKPDRIWSNLSCGSGTESCSVVPVSLLMTAKEKPGPPHASSRWAWKRGRGRGLWRDIGDSNPGLNMSMLDGVSPSEEDRLLVRESWSTLGLMIGAGSRSAHSSGARTVCVTLRLSFFSSQEMTGSREEAIIMAATVHFLAFIERTRILCRTLQGDRRGKLKRHCSRSRYLSFSISWDIQTAVLPLVYYIPCTAANTDIVCKYSQ